MWRQKSFFFVPTPFSSLRIYGTISKVFQFIFCLKTFDRSISLQGSSSVQSLGLDLQNLGPSCVAFACSDCALLQVLWLFLKCICFSLTGDSSVSVTVCLPVCVSPASRLKSAPFSRLASYIVSFCCSFLHFFTFFLLQNK